MLEKTHKWLMAQGRKIGRDHFFDLQRARGLLFVICLLFFLAGCDGEDSSATAEAGKATLIAQLSMTPEMPSPTQTLPSPPGGTPVPKLTGEPTIDVTPTGTPSTVPPHILTELPTYGVDPNQGNLGFIHPPVTIEENDFEDFDWRNQNLLTVAGDFVLAADVTWNSAYAESGCGFAVRSDGDEENPSQYLVGLTRGAQGHVLFANQDKGDVDLNQVTDIHANGIDPKFEWQNDTTNRLAVVGRGQDFTIYSNGTRLGTITGQLGLEEGFVAFFALNRSGGVRCHFDNAWLWRMNN